MITIVALAALAVLVAIGIVLFRRRLASLRAAAEQREAAVLEQLRLLRSARTPEGSGETRPAPAPITEPPSAAAASAPQAASPASLPQSLAPLLSGPHRIAFLLLRLALPECELFAGLPLGRVLGGSAAQVREPVDFVVCDRQFRVLALVFLDSGDPEGMAGGRRWAEEAATAAGLRVSRWAVRQLPRREQVRGLVLG